MMTDEPDKSDNDELTSVQRRPRLQMWRVRISLGLLLIFLALGALAWVERRAIADNVIATELEKLGLPATYEVAHVGSSRQVLKNIVIGDPARPDMTIESARVTLEWGLFSPRINLISLVKPRLYGTLRGGQLSFGTLDPLIFDPTSDEPASLPDIDLEVIDGRAALASDYGAVGLKADGKGNLRSGFAGILAVNAPSLKGAGCSANRTTLYGDVTTSGGRASFAGPLRLADLSCPANGVKATNLAASLDTILDEDFAGFDGDVSLQGEKLTLTGASLSGIGGTSRMSWREASLIASYDLTAQEAFASGASAAALKAEGDLRANDTFASWEVQSNVSAKRLQPGSSLDSLLAGSGDGLEGTLLEPILSKIRTALQREGRGSNLAADVRVRGTGEVLTANVPQATLRGSSGSVLFALSRFQLSTAGSGVPRFSGNFTTGGRDLPRIAGRMERLASGNSVLRVNMAAYQADDASLALPELVVSQAANGTVGFAGRAIASGPLPGGKARNLVLPISGSYSASGDLAMWRRCMNVSFDQLALANLTLVRRGLTLCPAGGRPILSYGAGGLRIAAGTPSLNLAGRLGETPIAMRSGAVGFAYPGVMTARDIDIVLGPKGTATRFTLTNVDAKLDGQNIAGTFAGTDAILDAVPLDILQASGSWSYAGGILALNDGSFTLEDREQIDRFQPLIARGATLTLENNLITAQAMLRNPESDRLVSTVDMRHSLDSGTGYADLDVPGLILDEKLQAVQLTRLALGVVANTYGTITGKGRIDWNADNVTSSGTFSSDSLDLAAAFGPVKGASGTVVFTDLLALTTAPNQTIRIGSVNPGIEVFDGELTYRLENGEFLAVQGGTWPFMGGTIRLEPVNMNIGINETRLYLLIVEGLDAAQFVEQMELGNLAATGIFDGRLPLIFDENGGRIEGGLLVARAPGGNVSYVGALTYEDLNPMANFAFDALRSLDYDTMQVGMDGSLTGELVTRVEFDGVRQGAGTSKNIITRQVAKLPIKVNVNVTAPFYKLITSFKSMYDPAYVRDPREVGLTEDIGRLLQREAAKKQTQPFPVSPIPDEAPIQTSESETSP